MAIAALILCGVFIVLAGGARPILQLRQTGDAGIRQFSARPDTMQWRAHYSAGIGGLTTGVAAPTAELIGLAPLGFLDHPVTRGLGVILTALGILATFAAQLAMGASWRIGVDTTEKTTLVTSGPFRLVRKPRPQRHATHIPRPDTDGAQSHRRQWLRHHAHWQPQVRLVEEPHLRQLHAPGYANYASQAGRFIPGIGLLRSG